MIGGGEAVPVRWGGADPKPTRPPPQGIGGLSGRRRGRRGRRGKSRNQMCALTYTLWEEEPGTTVIASETGEWCEHLDPEVFPARGEGEYEVYFFEPER